MTRNRKTRFLISFVVSMLALFCATTRAQSTSDVEADSNQLTLKRDRGEITWLEWRRVVNNANRNANRNVSASNPTRLEWRRLDNNANRNVSATNPMWEEFYAYTEYVAAEVDARRILPVKALVLIAKATSAVEARLTGQARQRIDTIRKIEVEPDPCVQAQQKAQYWCYGPASRPPHPLIENNCFTEQNRIERYCK